ncbi:MAG TPA: diguanylate cyclase [Candidatus Brocadiaceae bacterium]|nr:diguanylate cyclase [Candidatus Brocadiaceae bacterium]
MNRLSRIDGLTGIANRRHFDNLFCQEWKRAGRLSKPISLLLVDIDFFKNFNDTYGHQLGDECLKQVRIRRCTRQSKKDVTASRLPTDNFLFWDDT